MSARRRSTAVSFVAFDILLLNPSTLGWLRCGDDLAKGRFRMSEFPTITHVALTVSDLSRSVPWYELFDAKPVLDEDTGPFRHVVWAIGSTLVGLHEFPDRRREPFDERRVGLDHLAFACSNRAELDQWEARTNELGVAHGGIVDGPGVSIAPPTSADTASMSSTPPSRRSGFASPDSVAAAALATSAGPLAAGNIEYRAAGPATCKQRPPAAAPAKCQSLLARSPTCFTEPVTPRRAVWFSAAGRPACPLGRADTPLDRYPLHNPGHSTARQAASGSNDGVFHRCRRMAFVVGAFGNANGPPTG